MTPPQPTLVSHCALARPGMLSRMTGFRGWVSGAVFASACAAGSSPTATPAGTQDVAELPRVDAGLPDAPSGSTLEVTATSIALDGRALERLPRRGHIILPLAEALTDGSVKTVQIAAAPDLTMAALVDVISTLAAGGVTVHLRVESPHGGGAIPLWVPAALAGGTFHQIAVHVQHDRVTVHGGSELQAFALPDTAGVESSVAAEAAVAAKKALPAIAMVSFEDHASIEAVAGALVAARGLDCPSELPCQVHAVLLSPRRDWGGFRIHKPKTKECPPPATASEPGAMDKDVIRHIVRCHIDEVRYCYNLGLLRDPALAGRVSIQFNIDPEGKVAAAVVLESDLGDPSVANCIAKTVKRWTFPKPTTGGSAVVTYPFVLHPTEPAGAE